MVKDIFRIEKAGEYFQLVGAGVMCDGSNACFCLGTIEQCKAKAAKLGIVPYMLNDTGEYDVCMFKQPNVGERVARFRVDLQTYKPDIPAVTIRGEVDLKVTKVITPTQLPSDKNPIPDGSIYFGEYNKVWMRKVGRVYLTSSSANNFSGECWAHVDDMKMLEHNMERFIEKWFQRELTNASAISKKATSGLEELNVFFGRS